MLRDRVGAARQRAADAGRDASRRHRSGAHHRRRRHAGRRQRRLAAAAQRTARRMAAGRSRPISIPRRRPVGRVQFDVADFVPQRLKVTLTRAGQSRIKPAAISMSGPRAASSMARRRRGLSRRRRGAASPPTPIPIPQYHGYQFGRVDDTFSDVKVDLTVPDTDAAGVTDVTGTIGELADTTLPLKADDQGLHPRARRPHHRQDRRHSRPHARRRHRHPPGFRRRLGRRRMRAPVSKPSPWMATASASRCRGLTYTWVREDTTYQWYPGQRRMEIPVHHARPADHQRHASTSAPARRRGWRRRCPGAPIA